MSDKNDCIFDFENHSNKFDLNDYDLNKTSKENEIIFFKTCKLSNGKILKY